MDAVIDSGVTSVGVPSTIISLVENKPVILRKGAVTEEMINEVIGIW